VTEISRIGGLRAHKPFLELMRRVESHLAESGQPLRNRRRPSWLQLEQPAAMHFASTEVARVSFREPAPLEGRPEPSLQVLVRHFGLFAPYGPLPLHLTEHAMVERRFERNRGFEAFVNLASAEMAWLHYVASTAMHPVISAEQGRNTFRQRVTGQSEPAQATAGSARASASHISACRFSFPGVYLGQQRSAAVLRLLLETYFGVPIRLRPRAARWLHVPEAAQQRRQIGRLRVGSRVWDAQTIDIEVGPVEPEALDRWHRRAEATQAMAALVLDYSGGRLAPVIHLSVKTSPDMATRVGRMRLGTHAWVHPEHAVCRVTVYDAPQEVL
jgi:type VI secretion system protein ImpH